MDFKQNGKLYIVPTPVGNLQDMTFRAIEILKGVDLIGAEDTRKSGILLNHFDIKTPTFSYHKFNERSRVEMIMDKLTNGYNIAIISDAGTPGISDPAGIVVREVLKAGLEVETLPGATAFLPALVSSGFSTERFQFLGFLPEKKKDKELLLKEISTYPGTLIFYEAPHRLVKFIQELETFLGDRKVVIAREISKLYETYVRTRFSEFLKQPDIVNIKGEFVILVKGYHTKEINLDDLKRSLKERLRENKALKEIAKELSFETGLNKNMIYELALQLKKPEKN